MKKLLFALVSLLAACELQPAPKQAPPPSSPAGSAAPVAPSPTATAGSAAVPAPRPLPPPPHAIQPTAECQKTGIKVAELLLDDAEPSQKPAIERERVNIVRSTEEACTRLGWTPSALACIAQSKTNRDAHACLVKFPPPGATPAAGGAGSGSGAPVIPHPRPRHSPRGPS